MRNATHALLVVLFVIGFSLIFINPAAAAFYAAIGIVIISALTYSLVLVKGGFITILNQAKTNPIVLTQVQFLFFKSGMVMFISPIVSALFKIVWFSNAL